MSNDTITVFLADDVQIIVDGIIDLLASEPRVKVVGFCNRGMEVLDKIRASDPDVLVLDISLPDLNGLEVCRLVKAQSPRTAVLMLSMNANEQCIMDAIGNGASGYIPKEAVAFELCDAVQALSRGEKYLGQGIDKSILDRLKAAQGVNR